MANFEGINSMVRQYYDQISTNPSADPFTRASDTSTSDCGVNNSINQISNMTVNKSMNGSVRGYQYITGFRNPKTTGDSTPSNFDSTAHVPFGKATGGGGYTRGGGAGKENGAAYSSRGNNYSYIPATKTDNGFVSGLKKANGTIGKVVGTVVGGAWAGTAAAGKFALDMTKEFYKGVKEGATAAWDKVFNNSKENHPDDYNSIYNEDDNGNVMVPAVFECNDDGTVTMYLPDDVIADIYRGMRDNDFFIPPNSVLKDPNDPSNTADISGNRTTDAAASGGGGSFTMGAPNDYSQRNSTTVSASIGYFVSYQLIVPGQPYTRYVLQYITRKLVNTPVYLTEVSSSGYTNSYPVSSYYNDGMFYYFSRGWSYKSASYSAPGGPGSVRSTDLSGAALIEAIWGSNKWDIISDSKVPGVKPNPGATLFDPSVITANDIPTIIQQMNDNYSQQMGSPLVATVMNDSCNEVNITYSPVTIPITVGPGDVFPVTPTPIIDPSINPGYDPQSNPRIGPSISIDPDIDLPDIIPSIELPDIGSLFDTFGSALDWLKYLLEILAELLQGAPGGVDISLDPTINITTNNYYQDHDPEDPDTPLPPINVNPPEVTVNVEVPPATPGGTTTNITNVIQNPTLPNPTISVVIPPWPTESDEPERTPSTGWPTAMWNVYNPSQSSINAFGAWLWNPNFIDTIKRLFESPIDAVFTLHKVFVLPVTGGDSTIVVGSIDSGVPSPVVTSQYTNLDCGEIDLDEYFGNVFDYAPYTILQLYLPFIGIVELDPAYCMRSTISVFYTVDVFTGACVAKVGCKRDGYDICVYEFTGSCSVEYPVSYHSYSSIVASILSGAISATAGAAGTYITGNPMPAVYGAANAVHQGLSGRSEIRHSGSFAGAHGAMGIRKPYLIISRPILELADDFPYFDGYPANQTVTVASCAGYIRAKECHLNVPNAYKSELDELDSLFKSGVII